MFAEEFGLSRNVNLEKVNDMGKKIFFLVICFIIPFNFFGQNIELSNYVESLKNSDYNKKLKKKELKHIGQYEVNTNMFYHNRKYRIAKTYSFGDSVKIVFKRRKSLGSFYLSYLLIKYPTNYTTKEGVKIGFSTKNEIVEKKGKPLDNYATILGYRHSSFYFLGGNITPYPVEDIPEGVDLTDKVIAIKIY
jgi:hypothetical protein